MPFWKALRKKRCLESGFSLIELMAASLVLGVTITGVLAIIGTGRNIELGNTLRRQADIVVFNVLEDSSYHYSNYLSMTSSTPAPVNLRPADYNIPANLAVSVSGPFTQTWYNSKLISYKMVRVKASWTFDGALDSTVAIKRVTQVR